MQHLIDGAHRATGTYHDDQAAAVANIANSTRSHLESTLSQIQNHRKQILKSDLQLKYFSRKKKSHQAALDGSRGPKQKTSANWRNVEAPDEGLRQSSGGQNAVKLNLALAGIKKDYDGMKSRLKGYKKSSTTFRPRGAEGAQYTGLGAEDSDATSETR